MKATCSVDGCDRTTLASALCSMHYARKARTGSVGPSGPIYNPDRGCSIAGCDGQHQARGWCEKHYTRWRVAGDPLIERAVGVNVLPRPTRQPQTWRAMHHHLAKVNGRAALRDCKHCGKRARDWCYDNADPDVQYTSGTEMPYSLDVSHYIALCGSCHRRFDNLNRAREVISESAIMRAQQKTIEALLGRIETLERTINEKRAPA